MKEINNKLFIPKKMIEPAGTSLRAFSCLDIYNILSLELVVKGRTPDLVQVRNTHFPSNLSMRFGRAERC